MGRIGGYTKATLPVREANKRLSGQKRCQAFTRSINQKQDGNAGGLCSTHQVVSTYGCRATDDSGCGINHKQRSLKTNSLTGGPHEGAKLEAWAGTGGNSCCGKQSHMLHTTETQTRTQVPHHNTPQYPSAQQPHPVTVVCVPKKNTPLKKHGTESHKMPIATTRSFHTQQLRLCCCKRALLRAPHTTHASCLQPQ